MAEVPWLTIIGLGEDGPEGLSPASRQALDEAEVVMGASRLLALLPALTAETQAWPVPFAEGIPKLLNLRGRRVVMLASGDPFWFGAGTILAEQLEAGEWRALPAPSSLSLAAARLGWPLERTPCLALHAAPFARLRPHLASGAKLLVLLRDGTAVGQLAAWLAERGFGPTELWVMEALGGPREQLRRATAETITLADIHHPVCVGLQIAGDGRAIPTASGRPDDFFDHDGQITKRPLRALTLSALAPVAGAHLWDIGAGAGSVGIEWLLCHPANRATAIETRPDRAARIRSNAETLGVDRLEVIEGQAPEALETLPVPDAVFIGGGLSDALLTDLWSRLPAGTRLVSNAVTLESESLLTAWQARKGGSLLRIDLSEAGPLGSKRSWHAAYPLVQWSVTL